MDLLQMYAEAFSCFPAKEEEQPLPEFRPRRVALDEVLAPQVSFIKIRKHKRPLKENDEIELKKRTKKSKR